MIWDIGKYDLRQGFAAQAWKKRQRREQPKKRIKLLLRFEPGRQIQKAIMIHHDSNTVHKFDPSNKLPVRMSLRYNCRFKNAL